MSSDDQDRVCILLHGSSAHGEYLHPLASYLSSHGGGQVYVPNLRGHYGSGAIHEVTARMLGSWKMI